MNDPIHFPTEEENAGALEKFFTEQRARRQRDRENAVAGQMALETLIEAMRHGTNQSGHLRGCLYSLWNGQPWSVATVVNLDPQLREALCAVLLGFGYEDHQVKFFYDWLRDRVKAAGLWEWFLEAGEEPK